MQNEHSTIERPAGSGAATHQDMANAIRALAMDAVERANSGHPGMPMGMADVATVLFRDFLKFDPKHPQWPDRDRFVLSAGHGSMLQYALLYLTGYEDMTLEDLKNFRQLGSKTAGHPEYGHASGIETTTGPLGQGLANAVGMALAERMMAARFGDKIVDHKVYVIAGDGCLMEGISQEAISLAGHLKLNKLIVLFDDNSISIDGPTSLSVSEDTLMRFKACGWNTDAVDGHDEAQIHQAIAKAQNSDKPVLIACKTTIGYGAPSKAGKASSHGSPLGKDEIEGTRAKLGWKHAPFEIPEAVLGRWRAAGERGAAAYKDWSAREAQSGTAEFERMLVGELPDGWQEKFQEFKKQLFVKTPNEATRKSSQEVLEVLNPLIPELIGGSADLSGSNNTKTKALAAINANDFSGRYIHYGVREHAMGAIMNGMALHGGFIPYGGTFLVFSDYCRPAIRLAALMGLHVIFVMTHDSIGVGEDGPTHQPVEHIASLRAIPNLNVFRPCDAVETAECWALALATKDKPSLLCLTRQNLPLLRLEYSQENCSARGGYLIRDESSHIRGTVQVTLLATGSEVSIAVEAQKLLAARNISATVVSMPCREMFDAQPEAYRKKVIQDGTIVIAVEAASGFGWEKYTGKYGMFVGMEGFGASGPAPDLYRHFGITAEDIVKKVVERL
ncbi:MAG TPA: transketolase [Rickettsiales bacterium]|nr:transketolase [Rickettsiales bacterium]